MRDEMFYIGRELDPQKPAAAGAVAKRFELDPADLTTHALILGMTGSGKTGLGIVIVEEALRSGIPVIAIDPKGDLGNLLLLFDRLAPEQFAPWLDPEEARRAGTDPAALAATVATRWREGLAGWQLGPPEVSALARGHDALIVTPGSTAGLPLNLLGALAAPAGAAAGDEEMESALDSAVTTLIGFATGEVPSRTDPAYILLWQLVETAWRAGQTPELAQLIAGVSEPPFTQIGALPLETVMPQKQRAQLALALNNLLASPPLASWRQGIAVDAEAWLRAPDGRPRLTIITLSHLEDRERQLVAALVLERVRSWARRQPGTSELRALVYFDELYGFLPPVAEPPAKKPLMALLKQARAHGLGVVVGTQNPADLDYKGLGNIGTWAIGKLRTERDAERVRSGLSSAGGDSAAWEALLPKVAKRVFIVHDVHRPAPALVESRWAMSYLRGPLTRDEISRLMALRRDDAEPTMVRRPRAPAAQPVEPAAVAPPGTAPDARPALVGFGAPAVLPLPQGYLRQSGGEVAHPYLLVKAAVRYRGKRGAAPLPERMRLLAFPLAGVALGEVLESPPLEVREGDVLRQAPAQPLRHAPVPSWLVEAGEKGVERSVRERLRDKLEVTVFEDPDSGESSAPEETAAAFAARISGGGEKVRQLDEQVARKRAALEAARDQLSGRRTEKRLSIGRGILEGIGAVLGGRRGRTAGVRRAAAGVGAAFGKERMEDAAEARVEGLESDVAALEAERARLAVPDPARFTTRTLAPSRDDVTLMRVELVWVW